MSILDDNIELSTQKLVEIAIKEYILKFYGNFDADGMHKGYNKSQVKIESHLINSNSIQDIKFMHLYDNEDELNDSFIYIKPGINWTDWDIEKSACNTIEIYNIVITPNFQTGDKFKWAKNSGGFGLDVKYKDILNFLIHCNPNIYSKYYNFFYNKYYEPTKCK